MDGDTALKANLWSASAKPKPVRLSFKKSRGQIRQERPDNTRRFCPRLRDGARRKPNSGRESIWLGAIT